MTKFQKQMLTIAAAGALTAVTALPAMAFENEFHGMYTFKTYFSNFNKGDGAAISPATVFAGTTPGVKSNYNAQRKMNNYMDQRARIQYIAKASDDLCLVTQFEMNTRFGGVTTNAYANKSDGGTLDTDGTNIWTKHLFLDFNVGKNFNTKVGLMPYKDTIKGLLIDADVPMIYTTTKLGAYTLGLGFSRFDENEQKATTTTRLGDQAADLFIMDNTYAINKDTKVALSYYLLANYKQVAAVAATATADAVSARDRIIIHTLGLSGQTKLGALNLSGFAAMQNGYSASGTVASAGRKTHYHGYAANVAADMKMGSSKLKTALLYASGNNNTAPDAQNRGWVTSGVNSYNESGMMIVARNTSMGGTSTDNAIRKPVTNIALATFGVDADITEKFFTNANVGFAWAPASQAEQHYDIAKAIAGAGLNNNGSDFMGTEMNMEVGYKLYKNLTLKAQAAYMVLGGYYKNSSCNDAATTAATCVSATTPQNPYTMRLQASYTF